MRSMVSRFSLLALSAAVVMLPLGACSNTKHDAVSERALSAEEKMAPAEGLRLTRLFDAPVKGSEARFQRLEAAVQTLRDDVDVFAPNIEQRLSTVEKSAVAKPELTEEQLAKLVKKEVKIVGDVSAVRIGDHLDKTRIVLDMTNVPEGRSRMENDGKRLVVELPAFNWKAADSYKADSGALVSSWSYANGELRVDLLSAASVKSQEVIPAKGKAPSKLVIDLFAKGVHQ